MNSPSLLMLAGVLGVFSIMFLGVAMDNHEDKEVRVKAGVLFLGSGIGCFLALLWVMIQIKT